MPEQSLVNLGFTDEKFPKGTHICQIYSDDEERESALLAYILSGLRDNERISCLSDKSTKADIDDYLQHQGIDCDTCHASNQLTISATEASYFPNNRFDPESMLDNLKNFQLAADHDGQSGARIIGEMHPRINSIEGSDRLMEYEARVGLLQKEYPVTAVCQYNVSAFDGATIMKVLKVHPLMIVRGAVIRNPFFVPPEEILSQEGCC